MSNLLGSPHLKYVQDQIETRQEILGKTERSYEDINWANSTTSWIRLVSSVNIDDQQIYQLVSGSNEPQLLPDNGKEFRNSLLGLANYGGNQLSSELVLQGGAQNNNTKRFGVANEDSILPSSNFNYGYGGLDFGLKPIPGITSFSSKTYDNGSLREAEVTIIAHNTKQFEYLESIYLRLGYTMLLEWGNSKFPKDVSTYSNTQDLAELSLKNKFLNDNGSGPNTFYTEIEKLREKSKGNYDAFLAKVSNFSWEFNKEQQYVIKLNLISIGSVIESLKANLPSDRIPFPPKNLGLDESTGDPINNNFQNALINLIQTITIPNPKNYKSDDTVTIPYISGISWFGKKIQNNKYQSVKRDDNGNVVACFANYGNNKFFRYIKFETLLRLINENFLLYDAQDEPALIKIDIDSELYCYSNGFSISADPTKMLIGFSKNITGAQIDIFTDEFTKTQSPLVGPSPQPSQQPPNLVTVEETPTIPTSMFHDVVEDVKIGRIKNLFFSSEYLTQEIESNVDKDGNLFINDFINSLLTTANNLLGGVNKLKTRLVDKNFVVSDKNVTQQVIEIYDEVQPYEKQKLFNIQESIPSFKLLGVESGKGGFVTDFSLQTSLTKEFTTMISIGAQAAGTSVGLDATLFSKWNRGLIDRITPVLRDKDSAELSQQQADEKAKQDAQEKETALEPLKQISNISNSYFKFLKLFNLTEDNLESQEISPEDQSRISALEEEQSNLGKQGNKRREELQNKIDEIKEQQFTGYGFPDVNLGAVEGKTNFTNFISIQKEFFLKSLAYDAIRKQTITPTIGFIPINLSITLNGLSGIKIFDKLKVESKFLPNNYGDTLEFIITELDHFIENNKWYTRIGTLSIPNTINKPEAIIQIEELSALTTELIELTSFVGSSLYNYSTLAQLIINSSNTGDNAVADPRQFRKPGYLLLPNVSRNIPEDKKAGSGKLSVLVKIGELGGNLRIGNTYGSFDNIKLLDQFGIYKEFYKKAYGGNYFLEQNAAKALQQLAAKAKQDGISFTISSAYRSEDHQKLLRKSNPNAAKNISPHSYGGAIDIAEISALCKNSNNNQSSDKEINKQVRENSKLYQWLDENGPNYGWYNPARLRAGIGQDEAWHWEFWGVPGETISIPNYGTLKRSKDTISTFGRISQKVPLIEKDKNNTLAINTSPLYITKKGDIEISE